MKIAWYDFIPGMSVRFNEDPDGGDPNNPDATGDGTPANPGGGGGGDDPEKKETEKETHTIKVRGETREVTLEEALKLAEKSAGLDEGFRQLSEKEKKAEKGLRLSQLVEELNENPSDESIKEMAVLLGMDPGELMEQLEDKNKGEDVKEGNPTGNPANITPEQFTGAFKEIFGMEPQEAKFILDGSRDSQINAARTEIRKSSDEAVDKDEVLGKMINMEEEKKGSRSDVIKEMVAEDVLRRIQDGETFGSELLGKSIQKVRARITKFGIPNKLDLHPINLGQAPGEGLDAQILSDEPVDRGSHADNDGEDKAVKYWLQRGLKALREKKSS